MNIDISFSDPLHFSQPDPFLKTDLGSKKSAKIMENFHKNHKNIIHFHKKTKQIIFGRKDSLLHETNPKICIQIHIKMKILIIIMGRGQR